MSDNYTTTGMFTNIDITHKPKRMQGDNFKNTPLHIGLKDEDQPNTAKAKDSVPTYITLERAIVYFEEQSNSLTPEGKFYSATADWLKELLEIRANKVVNVAKTLVATAKDKFIEDLATTNESEEVKDES